MEVKSRTGAVYFLCSPQACRDLSAGELAHCGVKWANFYQPSWWRESREEILQGRVRKMCNIYNRVVFSYNSVVICVLIRIYVVFHEMKSNSGKTKSRFLVDVWLPPKFLFLCVCLCVCVTLLSYCRKHFQKQRAWIEDNCLLHFFAYMQDSFIWFCHNRKSQNFACCSWCFHAFPYQVGLYIVL